MKFIPYILLSLLLASCAGNKHTGNLDEFTDIVYAPQYAQGFELRSLPGDSSCLLLEVYRPDTMAIVIPAGGFESVMCMSSTYVGALAALGADNRIVAVSAKDYITNPQVKANAVDIGYDGAMDYEALLAAQPQLAMIYGIGGESPIAAKLEELGIPYLYINDFDEQSPLGRAEWLVAIGALVGIDGRKNFNEIVRSYQPRTDSVTVMLNAPYGGTWFIPGKDNYMSLLLKDGGAVIVAPQPEGVESRPLELEGALTALQGADIWFNPGQARSLAELSRFVPKASFAGAVWNQTPDFYESGAARPDLVLKEIQAITSGVAPDSLHYFIRLK